MIAQFSCHVNGENRHATHVKIHRNRTIFPPIFPLSPKFIRPSRVTNGT